MLKVLYRGLDGGWSAHSFDRLANLPSPFGLYVAEGSTTVEVLTPSQARDRVTSGSDKPS